MAETLQDTVDFRQLDFTWDDDLKNMRNILLCMSSESPNHNNQAVVTKFHRNLLINHIS